MAKRSHVVGSVSKRLFKRTAGNSRVHSLNARPMPMRGGFRI